MGSKEIINQALGCLSQIRRAYYFIQEHRLWTGLFKQRWVAVYTVIVACLFSYWTFNYGVEYIKNFLSDEGDDRSLLKQITLNTSSSNYLLIILLEVIIFHFSVQALNVLKNTKDTLKLKDFINAEKRMIQIMFMNYGLNVAAAGFFTGTLGLMGLGGIKFVIMFLVSAYFVGLSFFDNYNEQYNIPVKSSRYIIGKFWPASISLGAVVMVIMTIPIIGPIFGPILGAVSASLYGHEVKMESEEIPEKYQVKKRKKKKVKV